DDYAFGLRNSGAVDRLSHRGCAQHRRRPAAQSRKIGDRGIDCGMPTPIKDPEVLVASESAKAAATQRGLMARIRNYFLTGLVVGGPLAITIYLTWSFITWVDDWVRPLIPPAFRPETYLPFSIPGTGLIIAFVALTLLGFLTANLVGRTLVAWGENI